MKKARSKNSNKHKTLKYSNYIIIVIVIVFVSLIIKYFRPTTNTINVIGSSVDNSDKFYRSLFVDNESGWDLEESGSVEKITKTSSGWELSAGGNDSSTHYARIKYKLPERAGILPTRFYMRAEIYLPPDFYSKQLAGFRVMNTDNFTTTLNGTKVGASGEDELRAAVYIYRDHLWRIIATHENYPNKELWTSKAPIPVGNHVLEFAGDVAEVAPWYFKVDGVVMASGNDRLSPDTVPPQARVITRLIVGIDGAADQDSSPFGYTIKNFEIANYDLTGVSTTIATPTSTPTPKPTSTPTPKPTVTLTPTPTPKPTSTPVSTIDNLSPTITVSTNKWRKSIMKITVRAEDPDGIKNITISIDGRALKTCHSSYCSYSKSLYFTSSGQHTILITATDNSAQHNSSSKSLLFTK